MGQWPHGVGVLKLDEIDSTNTEARRRFEAGERGPLWITAARQTGGKARQGRVWSSEAGNLYATLLFRPKMPAATASLFSFVACLAVAELFEAFGAKAQVKWPNDALIDGKKCAGVLLEGSGQGGELDWLAIGCGVNLTFHPEPDPDAIHPPTSLLAETGQRVSTEDALIHLAASVAHWGKVLQTQGFAPVREAWINRAIKLGQPIEARMAKETVPGVFEDVDETGALVLRTPTGARKLHAADIYFA